MMAADISWMTRKVSAPTRGVWESHVLSRRETPWRPPARHRCPSIGGGSEAMTSTPDRTSPTTHTDSASAAAFVGRTLGRRRDRRLRPRRTVCPRSPSPSFSCSRAPLPWLWDLFPMYGGRWWDAMTDEEFVATLGSVPPRSTPVVAAGGVLLWFGRPARAVIALGAPAYRVRLLAGVLVQLPTPHCAAPSSPGGGCGARGSTRRETRREFEERVTRHCRKPPPGRALPRQ